MESWENELKSLLKETGELKTGFYSLEHIRVGLIDHSLNPYRSMFEMATQTWGFPDKWEKSSPRLRFEVVKKVLERKALPLALEAPTFTFQVVNVSRASFDQIARARHGIVFAARGFKDNNLSDEGFFLPDSVDFDKIDYVEMIDLVKKNKEFYNKLRKKYPGWAARMVLPIGTRYNYVMSVNLFSLMQLCSKRMCCIEQPDTVATAWLLREAVKEEFPLIANYLRPAEFKKDCVVKDWNGFSDVIGVPHQSCNEDNLLDCVEWDFPCTDLFNLVKRLGIVVEFKNFEFDDLSEKDLGRFQYESV